MPTSSLVFRVLVASPSDCNQERLTVREVVTEWNAVHSLRESVILEPVFWESHSRPALGGRPQALLNSQLVDNCDLLIGAFFTRLGTPTGVAESGTVEEIGEFRKAGKPVLLYFSAVPVQLDSVDAAEYARLTQYRTRMQSEGLYFRYSDLAEFRKLVRSHLSQEISDLVHKYRAVAGEAKGSGPEIRREDNHGGAAASRTPSAQAVDAFTASARRLLSEWSAERDSEPLGIDEGKQILYELATEAARLRSMVDDPTGEPAQLLDDATRKARLLQRHQLLLDGGVSAAEFWKEGDAVFATIDAVAQPLGS